MIRSSHFAKTGLLVIAMLLLATTSQAQNRPPIAEQIARTYGLDSFQKIDAIRYTFNIDFPGLKISRSWIWEPKTDRVTYEGKDNAGNPVKVTYVRSQLSSQPANVREQIEPAFINDHYNLFFPFHVTWDSSANVEDKGIHKLPLGKGSARQVVVKYPSDGGYTPGDTWELYLSPDNRVQQFRYSRAVSQPPNLVIMAWADYRKAGPFLFAFDRRGTADGKPGRVFFSNVSVKLIGSDTWLEAQ